MQSIPWYYLVSFHKEYHFQKNILAQFFLKLAIFSRNVLEKVMQIFTSYRGQK